MKRPLRQRGATRQRHERHRGAGAAERRGSGTGWNKTVGFRNNGVVEGASVSQSGEYESGCGAMTTQRRSAKLQLRRSISEQLRDSTAKAWDLLWRNVRERRLAGQRAKKANVKLHLILYD